MGLLKPQNLSWTWGIFLNPKNLNPNDLNISKSIPNHTQNFRKLKWSFLLFLGLITYCVVASVNEIPFTPVKDSMYIAGINAGSVFMGCATTVCTIYKYYVRE